MRSFARLASVASLASAWAASAGPAARTCDVTRFGAKGDNRTLDTAAIRAAIAACAGGGLVLLPAPGVYLSGALNLTSHQVFRVERGATLAASARVADFPVVAEFPSYGRSRDIHWLHSHCRHGALLGAVGAVNVSLDGGGMLDGRGPALWWPLFDAKQTRCSRPHLVEFESCDSVAVRDVALVDSPFWIRPAAAA